MAGSRKNPFNPPFLLKKKYKVIIMNNIKIKELALKFKTNFFLVKIKEEVKSRQLAKGYNLDGIFSRKNQTIRGISQRPTDASQSE